MVKKVCTATTLTALLVLLAATAPASAAPGDLVGSGHIEAGVPLAEPLVSRLLIGPGHTPEEAPYAFTLPVDAYVGETIETIVTESTGAGYFVEMAFFGGVRNIDTTCTPTEDNNGLAEEPYGTAEIRYRCVVPLGADMLAVYAHTGVALDIDVVVV